MSVALVTRGMISGFMGAGGEAVYVDVPVCGVIPEPDEFGELFFNVEDTTGIAPPSPTDGEHAMPRKISSVEIKPRRNVFPKPTNL